MYCDPVPQDIGVNYKDVVDQEYLRHQNSRELASEAVLKVLKKIKPTGKVLDIGCATGDFLEVARKNGYDAEGVEPSAWSAAIARGRGFKIHEELLEDFAGKHAGEYDIVTLWGVIEHFANPTAEIERIKSILKPGGILALWTGDVDSSLSRLLGRKWWYWQGQHIQYFTHASMKTLVNDHGFEHTDTHLYPFAASFDTISNSLRRYRSHRILTTLLKPFFMIKPNWYLRLPGEMYFIAKRN